MGAKSICYSVFEDFSREDLVFAAGHYGLSRSGTRSELAKRICDHIGRDIDALVSKEGPFTVSFWNDLLDEHDIPPCRSYQDIIGILTVVYGSRAEYERYLDEFDEHDEHPEFEKFADSHVVKLHWHETAVALNRLQYLPDLDRGFYALVEEIREGRGEFDHKLLYIGLAYEQSVVSRVRQQHQAYETLGVSGYLVKRARKGIESEVLVMVAEILAANLERKTKELYQDVENLLIARHRPRFNKRHKTYGGRDRLVIVNEGDYHPLRSRCST